MYVVMRSDRDPNALEGEVRQTINAIDPNLPLSSVRTMEDVMSEWAAERRLTLVVLVALATAAAALAAVGLFGVVGFMVRQRTSEIGIRRALGANNASVVGLVTREGGMAVATGMAVGLAGAWILSRLTAALLFHVSPVDPVVFCSVLLLIGLVAALAAYLPARRATLVDPITALRAE
jgi:putative ABC transport system permease protein